MNAGWRRRFRLRPNSEEEECLAAAEAVPGVVTTVVVAEAVVETPVET
jgi:hypothetical protein